MFMARRRLRDRALSAKFGLDFHRPGVSMADPAKRVGLFVTCLVDMIRPSVGFAAAKLLEDAGCTVEVPRQTCCGQPAFNSGDRATTRAIAEQVIEAFAPYD